MRGQTINTLRAIIVVLIVFFVLIMILDFVYDIDVAGVIHGKGVCGDGICQDGEEIDCPGDCTEVFAEASVSHLVIEDSSGTTFTWDELTGSGEYYDFPLPGSKEDCWNCEECYDCKDTQIFVNGLKCTGCDEYGCGTKRIIDESGKTVEIDGEEYPVTYPDDTCYYCDSCESAETDYELSDGSSFTNILYDDCQSCYDCKGCKEDEGIFWDCDECEVCETCETNRYDCTGCTDCPDVFEGEECFNCAKCGGEKPKIPINVFTFCTGCDGFGNCDVCEERTSFQNCEYCSFFDIEDGSFSGCMGCYFGNLPEQNDESKIEYGWNDCAECVNCHDECLRGVDTLFCDRLKECIGSADEGPCFIDEDIAVSLVGESFGYSDALSFANGKLGAVLEDAVQRCLDGNIYHELMEGGRQFVCYFGQDSKQINKEHYMLSEKNRILTDCGNIHNSVNEFYFNRETTYDNPKGFHFSLVVSNVDYNIGEGNSLPPCEFALQVCSQAAVTDDPFDPILKIYKEFVFFDLSGYDKKYEPLAWVYEGCQSGKFGGSGCNSGESSRASSRTLDTYNKDYYKGVFLTSVLAPTGGGYDLQAITVKGFDSDDDLGESEILANFEATKNNDYIYFENFEDKITVGLLEGFLGTEEEIVDDEDTSDNFDNDDIGGQSVWGIEDFYYAMFSTENPTTSEMFQIDSDYDSGFGVGAAKYFDYNNDYGGFLVDIELEEDYEPGRITETIATAVKDWNSVHRDDARYAKDFAVNDLMLLEFVTGPQDDTTAEYDSDRGNINYVYFGDTSWNIDSLDLGTNCWPDDSELDTWIANGYLDDENKKRNIIFDKSSSSPNFEYNNGKIDIIKSGKLKVGFGFVASFKPASEYNTMDIVLYPLFTVCGGSE